MQTMTGSYAPSPQRLELFPYFYHDLQDNSMEFILLPFSFGSYEMVGVSNYQTLKFYLFAFVFLLCNHAWPRTHKDLPALVFQMLGLKAFITVTTGI